MPRCPDCPTRRAFTAAGLTLHRRSVHGERPAQRPEAPKPTPCLACGTSRRFIGAYCRECVQLRPHERRRVLSDRLAAARVPAAAPGHARDPACARGPRFGPNCDRQSCRHWDGRFEVRCTLIAAEHRPHTLQEIAQALGLTRERVRQIEAVAIRKLNHPARRHVLAVFRD